MEGSLGAPPQRVCPNCARISWATGPQCPYCTGRFRRANVTPRMLFGTAAAMVVLFAILVLIAVNQVNNELDKQVDEVNAEIAKQFDQVRKDVQAQLQNGAGGTVPAVPTETPTPFPTTSPSPVPTDTATAAPTETPTESPTPTVTTNPDGPDTP